MVGVPNWGSVTGRFLLGICCMVKGIHTLWSHGWEHLDDDEKKALFELTHNSEVSYHERTVVYRLANRALFCFKIRPLRIWRVGIKLDANRKEWFCGKDVCVNLGYENIRRALYEQVKSDHKSQLNNRLCGTNLLYQPCVISCGCGEGRIHFRIRSFGVSHNRKLTQQNSQRWYLLGRTSRRFLWSGLLLLFFTSLEVFH